MKTRQVFNFSAGPATMCTDAIFKVQQDFLNWQKTGISACEISHRDPKFIELSQNLKTNIRKLFDIPNDYSVVFMTGGATAQFNFIPLNIAEPYKKALYLKTGHWSHKAATIAKQFCKVDILDYENNLTNLLNLSHTLNNKEATKYTYLHYCANETISGLELINCPKTKLPIIVDMTSNFAARKINIKDYDLIYAGSQKNLAPAGLTIIIIKNILLSRKTSSFCPDIFNYNKQLQADSMLNTPVTFSWYMADLIIDKLLKKGLKQIEEENKYKAKLLYDYLDNSNLYINTIPKQYRSIMNVSFFLKNEKLNQYFLKQAKTNNLVGLKGHRILGGMRASIYNAMPLEGIKALIKFLKTFETQNS